MSDVIKVNRKIKSLNSKIEDSTPMNLSTLCISGCVQKTILLLVFLCLLLNTSLFAHGDLDLQIERISKRIEKNSSNANLYLKRGQLYNQHKESKKQSKIISLLGI